MIDLKINDKSLKEYGILMYSVPDIPFPNRKMFRVSPPKRDGDLVFNYDAYEDINLKIIFNMDSEDLKDFSKAMYMMTTAERLTFSYDSERFYRVKAVQVGNAAQEDFINYGKFEVNFICDPSKYYISDPKVQLKNELTYVNDLTRFFAPRYHLKPTSQVTITVNGLGVIINLPKGENKEVIIDTSNLSMVNGEAVSGNISNLLIPVGTNKIELTGTWEYAYMYANRRDL